MASAQARLSRMLDHLSPRPLEVSSAAEPQPTAGTGVDAGSDAAKGAQAMLDGPVSHDVNTPGKLTPKMRHKILDYWDELNDATAGLEYDVADHLPGPRHDPKFGKDKKKILQEMSTYGEKGFNHVYWTLMQDRYCDGDHSANFVLPTVSFTALNKRPPTIANHVMICHPDDCERIARSHVTKMPDQEVFLGSGVLSTRDNVEWKRMRDHLVEAFLPLESISKICHVSVSRASDCVGRLGTLARGGSAVVDMNEFLLHEAMAQLQLALFGMPEDFVEETNKKLRDAFAQVLVASGATNVGGGDGRMKNPDYEAKKGSEVIMGFLAGFLERAGPIAGHAGPTDVANDPTARIHGPVSARIADSSDDVMTRLFNAATFAFAGHDTTANTMTWLLFEAAKDPALQRKLQAEVDALYAKGGIAGGGEAEGGELRAMVYSDLNQLEFMTRCIMETLRLWPVVPNGTARELGFDDHVTGPHGEEVRVPKGTYVQIANWSRHRDKKLWGADARVFNPDREWADNEKWHGETFVARNPASPRYSPFTYAPRSCLGMNFAQMEMRVILCFLLHNFDFALAEPSASFDASTFQGVNRGTMGPQNLAEGPDAPTTLAMHMHVTPRRV